MKVIAGIFLSRFIALAHATGPIAGLLVLAGALFTSGANGQERVGPLETAIRFFEANQASRCTEAFSLYAKGTQENIRAQMHRYERERNGPPLSSTPETRYCNPTHKTRHGTMRLVRQVGDEAIASREYTVGHWLNKYIRYGPYYEGTEEVRLVIENGAWRIDMPPVPPRKRTPSMRQHDPRERLVEVGRVDVFYPPPGGGLGDVVEATMVTRAQRGQLEAILRDPVSWSKLFPHIQTVDVLEATGDSTRIRLVFSGWDQPVTFMVKTPGDRFDRLGFESTWNVGIMFRGWWNLSLHHDGTRVTLHFVIKKGQWPVDLGERLHAPESIAEAVLGLEKVALTK